MGRRLPALLLALALLLLSACAGQEQPGEQQASAQQAGEGYFVSDGRLYREMDPLNPDSFTALGEKIESLCQGELSGADGYFYAVIPDKSWAGGQAFDWAAMTQALCPAVSCAQWISLDGALGPEDYLQTDDHWRQDRLWPVLDRLGTAMGFAVDPAAFTVRSWEGFVGDYRREREELTPETLAILDSAAIEGATVDNWQTPEVTTVYDLPRLESETPYDVFLSGATPLVTIHNPTAPARRLILVRDSFGSSLAPLLVGQYSEIVLVDLRYIATQLLPDYVDPAGAQVLFLWSARVANQSAMLK